MGKTSLVDPSNPALLLERVTKRFPNGVRAVNDVSLSVKPGELLILLGPSGCGKTTTLRLIAGLEEADSGHVTIRGADVTRWPPHRRGVAMLFQTPALYPGKVVGRLLEMSSPIARDRESTARMLRIDGILDRRVEVLSGGERQRVALARALLRRPAVLLLDEPLAHVDAEHRATLKREMSRLLRDQGIATVWVTHDVGEALAVGERIGVMHQGRLLQCGTPRELYEDPSDKFVGRIFGSPPMNFLRGRLVRTANGLSFMAADWLTSVPDARAPFEGRELEVGVRPGSVTATFPGDDSAPFCVEGIECAGEVRYLWCKRGELSILARTDSNHYRPGDQVAMHWDWNAALFFDVQTGGRLKAG